ncbi:hypothetical protein [Pseudaeromonas paramecii]|uniref:Uncharacterized protein n=1 Tax=Pseudaeromonas paramecii TaxID=2138166 RepID=A0ABP8Q474_9GAMM
MSSSLIDILDTSVKIGLGAIIAAITSITTLYLNRKHEIDKDSSIRQQRLHDEKKVKYVEFCALSQALLQKYMFENCTCQDEDYLSYLRCFNELQIISTDEIREAAYNTLSSVNQFITVRHSRDEREFMEQLKVDAGNKIALFQKIAQQEITESFK